MENKVFMRQDRFNGLLLDGMQLPERAVKGAVGVGEVKDQVCGQGLSLSAEWSVAELPSGVAPCETIFCI